MVYDIYRYIRRCNIVQSRQLDKMSWSVKVVNLRRCLGCAVTSKRQKQKDVFMSKKNQRRGKAVICTLTPQASKFIALFSTEKKISDGKISTKKKDKRRRCAPQHSFMTGVTFRDSIVPLCDP